MKKRLDKYKEFFKEHDEDLKIKDVLLGNAGINNFIIYNSSPRGLMMSGNLAQPLVLKNPDPKIVQGGIEDEFIESTIMKKIDVDSELINVVKRYGDNLTNESVGHVVEYDIIYKELETENIEVLTVPTYNKLHPYFGFKFIIEEELINSLSPGDFIEKGTIFAYPPTYDKENGDYCFGKNLNVALMSIDDTAEDGVVLSRSAAEMLKFSLFEEREISVGNDSFLLNLYGDDDEYKPFPEIGEHINPDAVVVASRKFDPDYAPALYGKKELRRFNPIFDNCVYTRGMKGCVIDVKVYYSNKKKKMLPKDMDTLLDKYANAYLRFAKDIVDTYNKLNEDYKLVTQEELLVSKELNRLIVECKNLLVSSTPTSKIHKMYRKNRLDLYKVEFVIEYEMTPASPGYKSSGLNGDKGVTVSIWEDEDMPVDEDGVRAHVIVDSGSTVSRLNIGRLYERYFNAASRKVKMLITNEIKRVSGKEEIVKEDIYNLTKEQIETIFKDYCLAFAKILDNNQYRVFREATFEEKRDLIIDTVEREFFIYFRVDNEKRAYEVVVDIEESKFKPTFGPVTYKIDGEEFTTKNRIMIAPLYTIFLNKIADGLLSTSSSKLNHFGLPIGVTNVDKNRLPWRNSPVRFVGETEGRLYGSYGGRKMLAELIDRGASTETHSLVYESILNAKMPTNIKNVVDRKITPYGEHKSLELLNVLFASVGMSIEYEKDKNRFRAPATAEEVKIDLDKTEITEIDVDKAEEED